MFRINLFSWVHDLVTFFTFFGGGLGKVASFGAGIAMGGSPLSSFGTSLAGQAIGGGSGGKDHTPIAPNIQYGGDVYTSEGKPVDMKQYFISGDKGVYNLLPVLGDAQYKTDAQRGAALEKMMAGDAKASAALKSQWYTPAWYGPETINLLDGRTTLSSYNVQHPGAWKDFGVTNDYMVPNRAPAKKDMFGHVVPASITDPDAVVGAAWTYPVNVSKAIAQYAAKNTNPFFTPYSPEVLAEIARNTPPPASVAPNGVMTDAALAAYRAGQQVAAPTPGVAPVAPVATPVLTTSAPTPTATTPVTPPPPIATAVTTPAQRPLSQPSYLGRGGVNPYARPMMGRALNPLRQGIAGLATRRPAPTVPGIAALTQQQSPVTPALAPTNTP